MRKAQRITVVLILLLMVVCFSLGFGVWSVAVNLFQSAGPPGSPVVKFIIREGETTAQIGDELEAKGLIRSALAFRLWAKYQNLDRKLQAGAYELSASMTIPEIVNLLLKASPTDLLVTIPEGFRIIQTAQLFAANQQFTKFTSDDFLAIAKSGTYTDQTGKKIALSTQYWFLNHVPQGNGPPAYALEGFLFPSTYLIPPNATAADIIKIMLNGLGEQICPGPSDHPDAYVTNEQQCEAHGAIIDPATKVTFFDALKKHYSDADGKNIADKLYHALTLASIVERETRTHASRQNVASIYYKRYLVSKGEIPNPPDAGLSLLQADPTLQYALGDAKDPWPMLQQGGATYHLGPYDTYQNEGLPPSPICGPGQDPLYSAVNPPDTTYYYFITDKDGVNHYASNYAEQQQNIAKYGSS
jgi:UPF0755 protein